jgi:peptidoglycan/xylan/chitin deacetylase (PgdA/CDA1 family)
MATSTVCLTFDFDAISVWIAPSTGIGAVNMGDVSRGEFSGRVAAPRILDLLKKHDIAATWFVPGHTVDTFPDVCKRISEEGHEMGYHGYAHDVAAERDQTFEMAMFAIRRVSGKNPVGSRFPGPFTDAVVSKLIEKGFLYDSSLQAEDYHPYRVRKGDEWPPSVEGPYKFGAETKLVEIPFQWYLDDWPAFNFNWEPYTYGCTSVDTMYQYYRRQFDYLHRHVKGGMIDYCFHPQVIGRGYLISMLDDLIRYIKRKGSVRFCQLQEVAREYDKTHPVQAVHK